jgi:hypothetical protein
MHHPKETQQKVRFHLADFGEHALAGLAIGPRDHIGSLSMHHRTPRSVLAID